MTKRELNRDIKKLAKFIAGIAKAAEMMKDNTAYFESLQKVAQPEFIRLINADDSWESLTAESLRILIVLNSRHRFIALHRFGTGIVLATDEKI